MDVKNHQYRFYISNRCMVCRTLLAILPESNVTVVNVSKIPNNTFYQLPILIRDDKIAYTNPNDIRYIFSQLNIKDK